MIRSICLARFLSFQTLSNLSHLPFLGSSLPLMFSPCWLFLLIKECLSALRFLSLQGGLTRFPLQTIVLWWAWLSQHFLWPSSVIILSFIFFLFSKFFVYIPNDFPFPSSYLPICPIGLLSTHSPITSFLFLCPVTSLPCWIRPFQYQGPLLTSSWESFDMLLVCWVFRVSGLVNIHLSVIAFHVYSFVIGLPHLGWYFPVSTICLKISWIHCF